jgi:FSR family fosmidomycin resistance protein-like MFS transporter
MSAPSHRLALGFSAVGHSYSHLFMLLYPTVVLVLQREWGMSFGELIQLAMIGQVMFGVAALPAGWLGDRWSATGMMVVFFIGTGLSSVATGFARDPFELTVGLAAIGVFASIYHPVGIAWMVRNAVNRGKALGVNGVFGSIGIASAAIVAGGVSEWGGWRSAFIMPGAICALTGVALLVCMRSGFVEKTQADAVPDRPVARRDMIRAFWVLSITMFLTGMIQQVFQIVTPKLFEEQIGHVVGHSVMGVSVLVSIVFCFTALAQLVGGHLADRYPMRPLYILCALVQVPFLLLVGHVNGLPVMGGVIIALVIQIGALPAENSLLARYAPANWRATAFGAKFVVALGASALAYPLVGHVYKQAAGVSELFPILAIFSVVVALFGLLLPWSAAPRMERAAHAEAARS